MTHSLIEAFIASGETWPTARLTVASSTQPADTSLTDVIAAGRRMGTRMIAAGVRPGDVVGLMLPNWREWQVAAVAAAQAGAVILPIVSIYGAKELGFILRQSRTTWLFTPESWRGVDYMQVVADCRALPDLRRHITTGDAFTALEAEGDIAPFAARDADDLAVLVYTSGTTADPKGVMHSARTLLAELESVQDMRNGPEEEAILAEQVGNNAALERLERGIIVTIILDPDAVEVAGALGDRQILAPIVGIAFVDQRGAVHHLVQRIGAGAKEGNQA